MTHAELLMARVIGPDYRNAPLELVEAHREIVDQMDRLYRDGAGLSSAGMLVLNERANELSERIAAFHTAGARKSEMPEGNFACNADAEIRPQ